MNALILFAERSLVASSEGAGYGLILLGRALYWLRAVWHRRKEVLAQMHFCGVKSLGVTMTVAIFTGMILALQAGIELSRFQQQDIIGALVAVTMCREMGPMMTAIILAACVGSAMAAELGTMRVSEEIDALEVMSINPYMYLVMPRVVALTLMCPVLTILTNLVGTAGGALVGKSQLDVEYTIYFKRAKDFLENWDIYAGIIKSVVLGMTIAVVGCTQGMRTSGGARGVGIATRNSVVYSLLLILIFGYYMTQFFY
jgi:phospholipid/cholesterol/gamma-HCH transport system permease protein